MKPLVLYHDQCADGFASAWVAWRKLGDEAEYKPVQYGQQPPDVKDRDVFILDFSYKRPEMLAIIEDAASVVVLDHHKTAAEELAGNLSVLLGDPPSSKVPTVIFDMKYSGARLTWDCFFPGKARPWIVDFVEDRDLWTWKLPQSREISAAIASYPKDFLLWESWLEHPAQAHRERLAGEGAAILRYQQQQVEQQVVNAYEIILDGHHGRCVNATHLISEIAGKLAENRAFGACFFLRADDKFVYSLRSREGGVDVSEIARVRGGGGHRNAAGFASDVLL